MFSGRCQGIFKVFCFQGAFRLFSVCLQGAFRVLAGCLQGVYPCALSGYALWTLSILGTNTQFVFTRIPCARESILFEFPANFRRMCIRMEVKVVDQRIIHACAFVSFVREIPEKGLRYMCVCVSKSHRWRSEFSRRTRACASTC